MKFSRVATIVTCVLFVQVISYAQKPASNSKITTYPNPQRTFTGNSLSEIAFPIGGIGTGSVSLGGRGDILNWEIFNRPDKGSKLNFSFFAVWVKQKGKKPVVRILEREAIPPYRGGGFGMSESALYGLPRLKEAEFTGEYPFARIDFKDKELPVKARLEAWNPFIPLDVDNSALPLAVFWWTFENPTKDTIEVSLASSLFNPIGSRYTNVKGETPGLGKNLNQYIDDGNFRGLLLSSEKVKSDDVNYGTMSMTTTHDDLDAQTCWYHGGWWDQCHIFWDDFSDDGKIKNLRDTLASDNGASDVGSLVLHAKIAPGKSVRLPMLLTWFFPNRENYWNGEVEVRGKLMKNYVAGKFGSAWEVARYYHDNYSRLASESRLFQTILNRSTLPPYIIDALSSQMSTIKTNVCILLEDGSFFGFEGNGDKGGCCPLNCTHVWNYEQALAFLFPQLERSMRETDFLHNTLPNGYMTFRTLIPEGDYWWKFKACADGQNGAIIRAYREWKLSGDSEWLRKLWPKIKLAMEFAWKGSGDPPPQGFEWTKQQVALPWDPDKNGVMEGEQHNTYDIEFYGPNTMTGSLYLGALKAASEMAREIGEPDKFKEYLALFEQGSENYDRTLWNGSYFEQDVYVLKGLQVPKHLISPEDTSCGVDCACKTTPAGKKPALDTVAGINPKYQYGKGCLSDQLLGQYLAHVAGLGYVLDPEHVRKATKSIFDNNFRPSMSSFANVQRVYALNNEAGLLLCSWPKGDRPALPFVYSDEVWTGIEYQVATTLVYNGWVKEGLEVVKAVRDRYAGFNRNPWDEEECGHHYARAMASWALLPALSGFEYDGVSHRISFKPVLSKNDFSTFWSCGSGWGEYSQKWIGNKFVTRIQPQFGFVALQSVFLGAEKSITSVKILCDGQILVADWKLEEGLLKIRLVQPAKIVAAQSLEIEIAEKQ
jgi:non-lysosomal glucosylceramidase